MTKGITYVETLVSIFILTLILGAILSFVVFLYRTNDIAWQQSVAIEEARRGVDLMGKEIRSAQPGDNGAYPIEIADDKQFVFYSDVDNDNKVERVRYFLGSVNPGYSDKNCYTLSKGGSCQVSFSNFFTGTLKSAQLRFSTEGDYGTASRYVNLSLNGTSLGNLCQTGCTKCAGTWQGTSVYDVLTSAQTNNLNVVADATSNVDKVCDWEVENHAMKGRFELSWTEEIIGQGHELRRGIVEPVGEPAQYPIANEIVSIVTSYIVSDPPIFEYYDISGNKIIQNPARLIDTRLISTSLVINVNPEKTPNNFELRSSVKLRNLR